MSRVNDEFNYVKISNEEDIPSFEFGSTPSEESASYRDNHDQIHDEVNDNPSFNDENKSPEKKEKRRKEEQKEKEGSDKTSKGSGGSSASSGAGGLTAASAAVVAAVSIVTGIVSVGAGIPQEVSNVIFTPHETSINCAFDIASNDSTIKYKVELYNNDLEARFEKESQIGHNELEFADLASSTTYTFEIFRGNPNEQQEYSYQSIFIENVTTLEVPVQGNVTLSFDAANRDGTMSPIEVESNGEYTLPVCIFVPNNDEYFGGWKVNGEGELHQPGETIIPTSDTTLVAGWTKFPTQENTVTATGSNFFNQFPEQPSSEIDSIDLMDITFLYKGTYFSSNSNQSLNLTADGSFVSTTRPFAGPISKITITTNEYQSGDVDFTMVYSASPIYEKTIEQGEMHTIAPGESYTFVCGNPDARYFCVSNADNGLEAFIDSMEFVYNTPIIENSFNIYFDANGGSGSFGPYTVRNTNKEQLPDIETIGFTAPDGFEFSGWKVKGVEDLLEAGTTVGISSDVTLIAQWKEKGPATN